MSTPTSDQYFDRLWSTGDDPWAHGSRWYEARKYDLVVATLLQPSYRAAFEPGCGAGFLTERLAPRCDRLVAMERHQRGVAATRDRCATHTGVEVRRGHIVDDWPAEGFDLVVLSEVLYYLDDRQLRAVLDRCAAARRSGTEVLAVHYRAHVDAHVRSGDDVHAQVRGALGGPTVTHLEEDFVLDGFGSPARP